MRVINGNGENTIKKLLKKDMVVLCHKFVVIGFPATLN